MGENDGGTLSALLPTRGEKKIRWKSKGGKLTVFFLYFFQSLIRCVEPLNYSAQFCLCTEPVLGHLGLGDGHFHSSMALSLLDKVGGRLVRGDLTVLLLCQNIKLGYLNLESY